MSPAGAVHLDAIDGLAGICAAESGCEEGDGVAARGEPAEDLVQVDLRTACLRIEPVLPVQDQDSQERDSSPVPALPEPGRTRRMSASSTPLTKRGLSLVPYFSARMMASWMATRSGTSSR